jgi:hypothetical protein
MMPSSLGTLKSGERRLSKGSSAWGDGTGYRCPSRFFYPACSKDGGTDRLEPSHRDRKRPLAKVFRPNP